MFIFSFKYSSLVTIPISRLLSGIPALTVSNKAAIRKTDLSPSMDDIEFERDRPRRIKTLSAVGLESKLQSLIFARRTLEGRLVRMIKKTQELMSSALNKSAVLERLDQISTTFQAFQDTHAELLEIAESSNHQLNDDDEARYFERIDEEVFQLKQQAHNWTRDLEGRSSSQPAPRTPSVKGQISRRSSRCSVSSTSSFKERMVEEKIKIAELETKASLQRERESVRSAIARLDLEEEIRVRKATAHILEEASTQQQPSLREAKPNADQLQQQRRTFPVAEVLPEQPSEPEVRTLYQQDFSTTNPFRDMLPSNPTFFSTHERLPLHIPNDIAAQPIQNKPSPEDSSVTKLLCQMLQQQAAPEVDIESYAGDSLDYHYFVALFDEVVERNILDARGRLTRLIKFTKGEAKELIQHCIQLPPSEGYITARRLLKERYGDPYTVICAYKKQIKNWAPIRGDDVAAFRRFHFFLIKCQSIATHLTWNTLDNPDTICSFLSKLPLHVTDQWNKRVLQIRTNEMRQPSFNHFVKFIAKETALVSDPLFSRNALDRGTGYKQEGRKVKNYHVKETQEDQLICPVCQEQHDLEDCSTYTSYTIDERRNAIRRNYLCYSCLAPCTPTHTARSCTSRRKCRQCNRSHPTTLHGVSFRPGEQRIQTYATRTNQDISMCVVPVKMRGDNKKVIHTFALLDNCSQGTFVDESLLSELNVTGPTTTVGISTINGNSRMTSKIITGIEVASSTLHGNNTWININRCLSQPSLKVSADEVPTAKSIEPWPHLHRIRHELSHTNNATIGLLIGADCIRALEPIQVIPSERGSPFAYKTRLGWCVVGPLRQANINLDVKCNRIAINDHPNSRSRHRFVPSTPIKDLGIVEMLQGMYHHDFFESPNHAPTKPQSAPPNKDLSYNDVKFLRLMDNDVSKEDGHYCLPLPIKGNPHLPNNRTQAYRRLSSLQRRFAKNPPFQLHYKKFMEELLTNGYAREAQGEGPTGRTWYLPHHGVFSETKKKIRVVFDCGAEFKGESLNNHLISGPDLTSHLVGVLTRFRELPIAVMADVEKMFYQVRVAEHHRSLLRFLWWQDGDWTKQPTDYEMNVHVFGATSSPSCSNYALRRTSLDHQDNYNRNVTQSLYNNFYVDDLLKSLESNNEAIEFVSGVTQLCSEGGFNLTKFISNSVPVLESIPESKRRPTVSNIPIGGLPTERCLGVRWDIENDIFGFDSTFKAHPFTRRGMLSLLSSIYDPCGYIAPFLLKGRRIIQSACQMDSSWDEPITESLKDSWKEWGLSLQLLKEFMIERCFKPKDFGQVSHCSLHHFSDASEIGYGQVSYFRLINTTGRIHCSLVLSKARVAPLKYISIPRLELVAATLSTKMSAFIKKESSYKIDNEYFWTDSKVVLGYIGNEDKRFKIFVANRVQHIRDNSLLHQWRYVPSKLNTGDTSSRGFNNIDQMKIWYEGPAFLRESEDKWPQIIEHPAICENDPEVKHLKVNMVRFDDSLLDRLEERISCWNKMLRVVAMLLRFIKNSRKPDSRNQPTNLPPIVEEIVSSKSCLVKMAQERAYMEEIKVLKRGEGLKPSSPVLSMTPFLDKSGCLRVGGRLSNSLLDPNRVHPLLLPRCKLAVLIARWCHEKVEHGGRNMTLNEMRNSGYWIARANSLVRSIIFNCVPCRRLRATLAVQIMSNLPSERQSSEPPFTYVGLDMFGPFLVKDRRTQSKRYGLMFTCLSSRAIHIETTWSLETDSFILGLRRFIARRGIIREIRSDNGTNFVGAKAELKKAFDEMDHDRIRYFLTNLGADWLIWKNNPPSASHMGGVWERQIRSARAVLTAILTVHPAQLTDESLRTYMTEAESIINSRPLTTETLSDVNSL